MAVTKDAQSLYQDVLHRTESDADVLKGWQNYIDEHGYDAALALFRTNPDVAKYVLSDEQEYAMDYERIANTGETGQRTTALSDMYDEVMQKAMAANESLLSGELDDQTVAMLFSKAAERGLQAGVGSSSQFAENIGLRDLGLTAESVKQQGIANATELSGTNNKPYSKRATDRSVGRRNSVECGCCKSPDFGYCKPRN